MRLGGTRGCGAVFEDLEIDGGGLDDGRLPLEKIRARPEPRAHSVWGDGVNLEVLAHVAMQRDDGKATVKNLAARSDVTGSDHEVEPAVLQAIE